MMVHNDEQDLTETISYLQLCYFFFYFFSSFPLSHSLGYGQTEGAAAATLGHSDDMRTVGHVGGPTGCAELALYDVPEMGYSHLDVSHRGHPCCGRGEICIRGPNVFQGYYKDEEKTNETIDCEGWLHSGDIGLWRPDGTLQIIDRKKNIFKLSQGEYVAPEKIENVLVRSSYIAQCFVYGDSLQSCLVALIVPEEDVVQTWWRSTHADSNNAVPSLEALCQDQTLRRIVLDDVRRLSKESQLHGFETVQAILLIRTAFSVENGFMTPTFKLKRQQIRDQYEKEINELYASLLGSSRSRL
jgi:long-chain acyl-CoA synthetase